MIYSVFEKALSRAKPRGFGVLVQPVMASNGGEPRALYAARGACSKMTFLFADTILIQKVFIKTRKGVILG